jgi:hypothetical protein
MDAARTSETSVDNYFTQQYIPEDNSELHTRRRENLKSHLLLLFFYYWACLLETWRLFSLFGRYQIHLSAEATAVTAPHQANAKI